MRISKLLIFCVRGSCQRGGLLSGRSSLRFRWLARHLGQELPPRPEQRLDPTLSHPEASVGFLIGSSPLLCCGPLVRDLFLAREIPASPDGREALPVPSAADGLVVDVDQPAGEPLAEQLLRIWSLARFFFLRSVGCFGGLCACQHPQGVAAPVAPAQMCVLPLAPPRHNSLVWTSSAPAADCSDSAGFVWPARVVSSGQGLSWSACPRRSQR